MDIKKLFTGSSSKILNYSLSEPINNAKSLKLDVNTAMGNLTMDKTEDNKLLVEANLQFLEGQEAPTRTLDSDNGQTQLSLKSSSIGKAWMQLPWVACNGATEWEVNINPKIAAEINAHTGGGNVKIDLSDMTIDRISADTGGGNLEIVLPSKTMNVEVTAKSGGGNVTVDVGEETKGKGSVEAKSGAGNVTVRLPQGIAARIYATSGLGKVIMDERFEEVEEHVYQTEDYDGALNKIEVTAQSGAGNVSVG